ncbi:MAG: hypothetical protein WCK63_15440, partial [Betaproteobacteria bacterium]
MKTIDWPHVKRFILALLVAALVACSWLSPLEPPANQTVDAGLKRALISFATARALNAVISVAQGTEIAFQPAGVGMIFSPGQVLDPVNDLVEQFSNLMLTASVAFGVEKVLITIGAHWGISLLLTLSALAWAAFYLRQSSSPSWLSRLLVLLLMARFALPLVVIGSDTLFEQFMHDDYQASQQGIELISGQLDKINPSSPATAEAPGLIDKFKDWAAQQPDLKTRYSQLKQAAEQTTERIITLMVIFLL